MKNKKRILALLLAATTLAGSVTGCGSDNAKENSNAVSSEKTSEATESSQVTEDSQEEAAKHPVTTEPITISILTARMEESTNDATDLWFFKYLEYWLNEQGYDATIEVTQCNEAGTQIPLMLGTDTLPDLIWGIDLSPSNAVVYGAGEEMILDWAPYINEEDMPNFYNAVSEEALAAVTCIDGGVYSLPYLTSKTYHTNYAGFGMVDRVYVNQDWLEQCNLEMPTDIEGFLDMLRAFKSIKLESGDTVIPLLENAAFFQKWLWVGLGYYGTSVSNMGLKFAIKDDAITFPAYTDDYRTYVEIMKTCYDEGLISQDYITMDTTTIQGYMISGVSGVLADWTLQNSPADFNNWVAISPMPIGDNDEVAISLSETYGPYRLWASASTEYPEVVALIADYLYSKEGACFYNYGPQEGQDPLGLVDGWYLDEDGNVTTKAVEDGTFAEMVLYSRQHIFSNDYVGCNDGLLQYAREIGGRDDIVVDEKVIKDTVTGKDIVAQINTVYTDDNNDGWWRITTSQASEPYLTTIKLPNAYLTEEDELRAAELKTIINPYVEAETAKFITGLRPMEEMDAYFEELKGLGIEEYITLYENAYSSYMDSIYK